MTIMNAALAMGAVFSTPGTIFIDNGSMNHNFSVISCTADTVIVSGRDANILESGHIFVYIGDDNHMADDGLGCNLCSPLFRKVVGRSNSSDDENSFIFTTTSASFQEVFPNDVYDASLAASDIEPYFNCDRNPHEKDRFLTETSANICEFVYTATLTFFILTFICICFAPICICFLAFLQLVYIIDCNKVATRRLEQKESSPLVLPEATFPATCKDWGDKGTDGNCLYVDGTSVINDALSCFACDNDAVSESCRTDLDPILAHSFLGSKYNFDEAVCNQGHCYSSKFNKLTCDNLFYKTMKDSCPPEKAKSVQTTFPLSRPVLSLNCQMMSALFFLGMKIWGNPSYESLQLKQLQYASEVPREIQI